MRLHGKLANRLLSVDCAIFLQTVGFLLHCLMAVGGNQLAVSVVILPRNVGLMTRLTVMTTELHHQMRHLHGLLYPRCILQCRTSDAVGIQMVVLGNTVVHPEACGILAHGHIEVPREHRRKFIGQCGDNLIQHAESVVLFIHTSFLGGELFLPCFLRMNKAMVLLAETDPVFESLASVLVSRDNVMAVVDSLLAEDAVTSLHIENSFFNAALSVERSTLILPSLDVRVVQLHKCEAVDLQHDVRDREELLHLLHQIDMTQQQVVCRRCEPTRRADPVVEPGFLVADTLAVDRFLTSGEDSLDNLLG